MLNQPQKDRQLPKQFKQAKDHIVSSRQNHRSVQQPGRFAKQKRDQPRRVDAGSQQSPPPLSQRRPDTHVQETYLLYHTLINHSVCILLLFSKTDC